MKFSLKGLLLVFYGQETSNRQIFYRPRIIPLHIFIKGIIQVFCGKRNSYKFSLKRVNPYKTYSVAETHFRILIEDLQVFENVGPMVLCRYYHTGF